MEVIKILDRETFYRDEHGRVLPWWTGPSLEWLASKCIGGMDVLEWGCGTSSLWFIANAGSYCGVEHDPRYQMNDPRIVLLPEPDLANEFSEDMTAAYARAPFSFKRATVGRRRFDLVVIDGIYRRACARYAPMFLREGGNLVIDNANWDQLAGLPEMLSPLFAKYTRHVEPGRSPEWATDVYEGFL